MFFLFCFFYALRFCFGPQHPASHGVLCLFCFMIGDVVLLIDINIGYLHRGTEKLCEYKTVEQSLPYMDRLDYVSVCCNEHLFCLCFELLIRVCLAYRLLLARLLLVEFTRTFNGFLCITCLIMDIGCLSPVLWAFEERDKLMTFFDLLCGCRMHLAFCVVYGLFDDLCFGLFDFLFNLLTTMMFFVVLLDFMFVTNFMFYTRLRGLSFLCVYDICFNSCSGVLSRSCGMAWDCRLFLTYDLYFLVWFDIMFCFVGDMYDRFLIRLFDMRMSLFICKQIFCFICFIFGFVCFFDFVMFSALTIETIIMLFWSCWCLFVPGMSFCSVEHPKGEYFCFVVLFMMLCSRLRLRCADFLHLFYIDLLCRGFLLHDLVAFIGNVDVVFGSVDR